MAENSKKIPQKWVVALFPESKQYSVIPTNWIVQNDSKIKFCHWPPGEVNSDVIQNANVPDPTWKLYRIKIYGGNKTFDNFNKAWHQQVIVEESATETDNDTYYNKISKSKQDGNPEFQNLFSVLNKSGESNDNEENGYDIMAPSTSMQAATQTISTTPNYIETLETNSILELGSLDVIPIIQSATSSAISLESTNVFKDFNLESPDFSNLKQNTDPTIKMMLQRILLKIENMEKLLKKRDEHKSVLLDELFLSKFPIKNSDEFKLVQSSIQNDIDFVLKLENFIGTIGGRDGKEHTTRALAKLLTDEYAGKCTMTGRGKNIEMKVGDSELIKIIKKIVKIGSKIPITDSDIEKEIAEWLRRSNTRFKREKLN